MSQPSDTPSPTTTTNTTKGNAGTIDTGSQKHSDQTDRADAAPPSVLSHVSLGTNDYDKAIAFYDAVMPVLGIQKIMEHPGATAYGRAFPEFWVQTPYDGQTATVGNGTHIAFVATSKAMVDAFHTAGLKAGATDDGPPGPRKDYGEPYYGSFLRDLDGNKIEATFWDMALAQKLGMA